jgi:hypothetical protein
MIEYKGFRISGESIEYMEGCESRRTVGKFGRAGFIIEVARIEGEIFKTMKETEAHGPELAKKWVDKRSSVV